MLLCYISLLLFYWYWQKTQDTQVRDKGPGECTWESPHQGASVLGKHPENICRADGGLGHETNLNENTKTLRDDWKAMTKLGPQSLYSRERIKRTCEDYKKIIMNIMKLLALLTKCT